MKNKQDNNPMLYDFEVLLGKKKMNQKNPLQTNIQMQSRAALS